MAKRVRSVAVFSGVDSACRPVEQAYRADGVAFGRDYAFNGYGMGWSRWYRLDKGVTPLAEALSNGFVEWGFKTLSGGVCDACWVPAPTDADEKVSRADLHSAAWAVAWAMAQAEVCSAPVLSMDAR